MTAVQYARRMKIVMVVMLVLVLVALASAGVFMLRRREGRRRPGPPDGARAGAARGAVGGAVPVRAAELGMGWIKPTGLPIGR
jgi:hypothetical protein